MIPAASLWTARGNRSNPTVNHTTQEPANSTSKEKCDFNPKTEDEKPVLKLSHTDTQLTAVPYRYKIKYIHGNKYLEVTNTLQVQSVQLIDYNHTLS